MALSANAAFQGAVTKLCNVKYTLYTTKVNTIITKLNNRKLAYEKEDIIIYS